MGADALTEHALGGRHVAKVGHDLGEELHDNQSLVLELLIAVELGANTSAGELGEEGEVSRVGHQVPGSQGDISEGKL